MIRTVILTLTPLFVFPYVSRMLGASSLGKVQYIQSIASYFQLFATFGILTYGVREGSMVKNDPARLEALTWDLIDINLVMTCISLVIYSLLMQSSIFSNYKDLSIIFGTYILCYGINFDWIFTVKEKYIYITFRTIIGFLISLAIVFFFVKGPDSYIWYAISIVVPYIVNFLSNGFEVLSVNKHFRFSIARMKRLIKPIALIFSISVAANVYSLLDSTMLGFIKGDRDVGLYTAASKLCRFSTQLVTTCFTVFTPRLTYYIATNQKKLEKLIIKNMSSLCVVLIIPIAMGLLFFSRQAIEIFSGYGYSEAVMPMKIIAVTMLFSAFDGFIGYQVFVPYGLENKLLTATVFGSITDLILNIILIPNHGVMGATYATFIAELVVFSICIKNAKNIINYDFLKSEILKCGLACAPICIFAIMQNVVFINAMALIFVVIPICIITYIAILLLLKENVTEMILSKIKMIVRTKT